MSASMREAGIHALVERVPRAASFSVVCGMLMVLPTLWAGLIMDDVLMRVKLLGVASPWTPAPWWDLYTFAREDLNPVLLAAGHHPWWADPEVRMTFFRPLSAATHWLDYALWPDSPVLQHLHSVCWYGAAVAVAGLLFRSVHRSSGGIAALAALVFAVGAPNAAATGWLAGRNTLIAFVFAAVVLVLHIRWRRGGGRSAQLFAVGALGLALLTGEAALGGLAYILSWEACLADDPWRARLRALLPYGGLLLLWRGVYVTGGFGAARTAIYHDPSTGLMDALRAVAVDLPVLLLGRWSLIPLDFWGILPQGAKLGAVAAGATVALGLVLLLRDLLRSSALARFWGLGMLLSLLPFSLTMPMDRLVLFAGLGSAGLLAMLAFERRSPAWVRGACSVLLVLHLPLSAGLGLVRSVTLSQVFSANSGGFTQAPTDAAVPDQTFVYVSSTFHRTHYTTLMRGAAESSAVPKRCVVLTSMATASTVRRIDEHTLEVAPAGGYMLSEIDRVHRRDVTAFSVGDRVSLPDLEVEIVDLGADGRPTRALFHFKASLEDPSLRWLVVTPDPGSTFPPKVSTRAFTLPAIGESVEIESAL